MHDHQSLNLPGALPAAYKAMSALHQAVLDAGLDPLLLELVKTRASQINGCAYCIDMHTKDALARGESAQRLFALSAWRETSFFSEAEEAALALTEVLTELPAHIDPTDATDRALAVLGHQHTAALIWAIAEINAWNRVGVGGRAPVGDYVSPHSPNSPASPH
jgi:AhpD family alkylhydroperoxidase